MPQRRLFPPTLPKGGLYVLILRVARPVRVTVGRLGRQDFKPGSYFYVGTAKTPRMPSRLARHFAKTKTVRWHIDYLTELDAVEPVGAVIVAGRTSECALNMEVGRLSGMVTTMPGFGSSDCTRRPRCPAHLWFSAAEINVAAIERHVGSWFFHARQR